MSGWNNLVGQNLGAAIEIGRRSSVELFTRLRTGSGGTQYFARTREKRKKDEVYYDDSILRSSQLQNRILTNGFDIPDVATDAKVAGIVVGEDEETNPFIVEKDETVLRKTHRRNKIRCMQPVTSTPTKQFEFTANDSKTSKRHGNNHLGLVLSALYAKLLVVCGTGFSLAEVISSYIPVAFYDGFYLYLYFVSIIFMTCILGHVIQEKARKHATNFARGMSIRRSSRKIRQTSTEMNSIEIPKLEVFLPEDELRENSTSTINSESNSSPFSTNSSSSKRDMQRVTDLELIVEAEKVKEHGTHFGSFYLRMGAVAFGVGSMIYSGLEFGQYFELKPDEKCHTYMIALTPAVRMIFTFMQMYFIFLNSKMAVSKVSLSSQFGLMHMIGTNLCVWLNVLVQETKHEILHFYNPDNQTINFRYEKAHKAYLNLRPDEAFNYHRSHNYSDGVAAAVLHQGHGPSSIEMETADFDLHPDTHHRIVERGLKGPHTMYECGRTNIMGSIVQDAAPFLFPCTVEYSLICAAICYVMWKSMAKRRTARISVNYSNEPTSPSSAGTRSPHHYTVDCARANKGLFVGIFFLVLTIMSIIINLVLDSRVEHQHRDFADLELSITEIVLYTSATLAVMIGMCQVRVLRYARQRNLELDNILLIVSQTGSLIFNVFTIISGQFKGEKLVLITALTKVIQLLMQTLFILDASKRAASTVEQARKKPGREVVTFLLVTNLAMWLINALEKSRGESHPAQLQFYGVWGWTIITHISMPLAIFYRFHSTVCLCEIWKRAYKLKRNF